MGVIARFFISQADVFAQSDGTIGANVTLKACQRSDEDNVSWTKWTPSGELTMCVMNPSAAAFFRDNVSKDCTVTIDLAGERSYGGSMSATLTRTGSTNG